ncbi:uncharacterized protein LAESUDRAFT_746949 [Laetiporus sulphureus 93-53]|uniref:Uncharacterized protein n=1 Tax=Laetiporus sulphureus 93-53 TaxID=1314785 RepID=A0A165H1S2_9APHY|nr:uncharacterized protein LAESUDRAFT_746949 [Laetiporus sulphureus 93-53]KZT11124.1 hypothetical protein LAESUDRAFT_746949 [Laetiporus sulphureus 93-53]
MTNKQLMLVALEFHVCELSQLEANRKSSIRKHWQHQPFGNLKISVSERRASRANVKTVQVTPSQPVYAPNYSHRTPKSLLNTRPGETSPQHRIAKMAIPIGDQTKHPELLTRSEPKRGETASASAARPADPHPRPAPAPLPQPSHPSTRMPRTSTNAPHWQYTSPERQDERTGRGYFH